MSRACYPSGGAHSLSSLIDCSYANVASSIQLELKKKKNRFKCSNLISKLTPQLALLTLTEGTFPQGNLFFSIPIMVTIYSGKVHHSTGAQIFVFHADISQI